jgi:hypothetical protein
MVAMEIELPLTPRAARASTNIFVGSCTVAFLLIAAAVVFLAITSIM